MELANVRALHASFSSCLDALFRHASADYFRTACTAMELRVAFTPDVKHVRVAQGLRKSK